MTDKADKSVEKPKPSREDMAIVIVAMSCEKPSLYAPLAELRLRCSESHIANCLGELAKAELYDADKGCLTDDGREAAEDIKQQAEEAAEAKATKDDANAAKAKAGKKPAPAEESTAE